MTRRLALLALQLYPLAFRRRYEAEMRALLEHTPVRAVTVLDLLRGALAAHVRPPRGLADLVDPGERVRASLSAQLACWVGFAAVGFGFYKTTEDQPFRAAGNVHPLLGAAHGVIEALAVFASLAVLLGALPLIVCALSQARRDPSLRRVISLPPLAVLGFTALTAILVVVAHSARSQHPTAVGGVGFIAWALAGLACGGICVVASGKALRSVSVSRGSLVMALACGTFVSLAMAVMTLASGLYAAALYANGPQLVAEANGPLQAMSVGVSLIEQFVLMALAAMFAATTTRRGWRAVAASGVSS